MNKIPIYPIFYLPKGTVGRWPKEFRGDCFDSG